MNARLKHRWSLGHNYLAGITADKWWQLLRDNNFSVDVAYWHRAAFISLLSVLNSISRRGEDLRFGNELRDIEITRPPVFILGHWRSGTTHLHNLLAQDDGYFAFPNTYQVINPETFLTTEETNIRRFAWLIPEKRPMDNMKLSFTSPQEDEFAPLLTCLMSSYLGVSFPRHAEKYAKFLTFRNASENEKEIWKSAFARFLRKLTFKNPDRTLLLKSPAHTARVRLLLEMFPDAKFIHIHRDPSKVFQSFRHYYDTAVWHTYLQKPDLSAIDDQIIERFQTVYAAFFEDVIEIPEGNFHEIAFSDLEKNPLGVTREIYERLDIPNFETAQAKFGSYTDSLQGYEKNQFASLTEPEKVRLRQAWGSIYERWGYTI